MVMYEGQDIIAHLFMAFGQKKQLVNLEIRHLKNSTQCTYRF